MQTDLLSLQRLTPTKVVVRGSASLDEWRERLRVHVPGHEYMPRFQHGQWDGTWAPGRMRRYGDEFELRCSVGTAKRLIRDCAAPDTLAVMGADEVDRFFAQHPTTLDTLHDNQREALRSALTSGWGRLAMATNAGKGAVIALMTRYAREQGKRALVLCDELSVYDALRVEITRWAGREPGRVEAGVKLPPRSPVTLAMVQTLVRRLDPDRPDQRAVWRAWLAAHEMLLLDEADKATAASWRRVIADADNSIWRVGFSGSFPDDLHADLTLTDLMGPVLFETRNKALIEAGVSARPLVELHGYDVTAALREVRWSWAVRGAARRQQVYDAAVTDSTDRHAFVAALVRPGVPTAIIVNRIDHGQRLTAAIRDAEFLDGSLSPTERREALDRFTAGRTPVVVVTKILDRGTNRLGAAQDIIFASGEGSTRQTLQRVGRGLRRHAGKATVRIVDVVDRVTLADGDRHDMEKAADFIHAAGRQRMALYAEEGFDVTLNPRVR